MTNGNISGSQDQSEGTESLLKNLRDGESLVRLTLYPANGSSKVNSHQQKKPEYVSWAEEILKRTNSLPKLLTKNLLPFCILYLLSQEPRYGNEILNWLRERAALWAASPGTIYPLLQHLEQEGLIQGKWEPGIKRPRHVYEITERGRAVLKELQENLLCQLKVSLTLLTELLEEIQLKLK